MAILIDSSVFITVERRGFPPDFVLTLIRNEEGAMASVTASELLVGVHRADTSARRVRREAFVEAILVAIPVVPFDLGTARVHAQLSAQLAATGRPIGAHDLLIAATALAKGYRILTDNLRDFQRVPGLAVQQPNW